MEKNKREKRAVSLLICVWASGSLCLFLLGCFYWDLKELQLLMIPLTGIRNTILNTPKPSKSPTTPIYPQYPAWPPAYPSERVRSPLSNAKTSQASDYSSKLRFGETPEFTGPVEL